MQSEHWDVTSTVIRRWWPPLHDRDRVPEADLIAAEQRLNLRLPQALRDWYLRAGRRLDFMGNADHFLPQSTCTYVTIFSVLGRKIKDAFVGGFP